MWIQVKPGVSVSPEDRYRVNGLGDHVYPEINFDGCPRAAMKVANIFGFRQICRPPDFINNIRNMRNATSMVG
jgi:hypothetical protein